MRVLVFFDLPVLTAGDRREYRKFRKYLIETGFLMMQESVYCKLVQNNVAAETVSRNIHKHKPLNGLVQLLRITEKQFAKIEYVVGDRQSDVIDSDEKLVVL